MIHVVNLNKLPNWLGNRSRETLENAFVASSVTVSARLNGVPRPEWGYTWTVPPNLTESFGASGHWPSTVTCGQPVVTPCTVVGSPAVIPGENTVVFFAAWIHTASDPKGRVALTYTIRGTLNGTPVTLTASAPPFTHA
jgi:hypothetical protein